MDELMNPAVLAVPLYAALIFWEVRALPRRLAAGRDVIGYEKRDTVASIAIGFVSLATVGLLNLAVLALSDWLWQWRITDLGNGVVGWTVALLGWDFAYYWLHRVEHESRILWSAHVNHHSSRHYNLSTALRQPWTPLVIVLFFPPLALIGVRPWMIMFAGGFNLVYQFWIHTEAVDRLPRWVEFIFNTPSHHRVHHGSNQQYLDRNHGGVLIIWDRLFGTFEPEVERVRYGLTKNIDTFKLWTIFNHELVAIGRDVRSATRWRDRFGYVFAGPGWKPAAATLDSGLPSRGQGANAARMPEAPSSQVGGR